MKILYIGSGFVGACSAAVMADSGHEVLVYDIDKKKIEMLSSGDRDTIQSCLFEEGLGDLLIRNKERINFTTDYKDVADFLDEVEAIFMCLPTPEKSGAEGESDLTYYFKAAEELSQQLAKRNSGQQSQHVVIINKSTVPVQMVNITEEIMTKNGVKNFGVVSNPEFLVEGKAIEGSVRPDRVVVGAWKVEDFKIMRQLYQRYYDSPTVQYLEVNPIEAAAGKLLANYLLFNRLATTFDVVGRLCESFPSIQFENIRQILTSEKRIGSWGFYDSVYAGGSCFIKDAASLAHQLEEAGAEAGLVRQVLASNRFQRDHFFSRAEKEAGFDWRGKTVAVLGVAFKRDTNDIRNSPVIDLVGHLIEKGAKEIRIFDPAAAETFKILFDATKDARYSVIRYCSSEDEVLKNSQACLILTDWPQFRSLGDKIKKVCPPPYLIMDGRRIIQHQYQELSELDYQVIPVGGPTLTKKE